MGQWQYFLFMGGASWDRSPGNPSIQACFFLVNTIPEDIIVNIDNTIRLYPLKKEKSFISYYQTFPFTI